MSDAETLERFIRRMNVPIINPGSIIEPPLIRSNIGAHRVEDVVAAIAVEFQKLYEQAEEDRWALMGDDL